ncbi:MAG: 5'-nucleotidase C-terminal domain-containing protein [Candidatus Metalachnospira sp.]|nr:5'-nucleotidase C-terminal domain-containing protein [Candidatus Metalachnospira sp.]
MKQKKRSIKAVLAAILAVVMLFGITPSAFAAENSATHITILGTSDMHGNIWGYSYEDAKETANNGMARVYSYIQQVRAENPNTILVDNGDTIQGTILTDDIYNKQDGEHPVIAAMNYMGYDAMTLGNHEFNFGLNLIDRIVKQAKFPILAANATLKDTSKLLTGAAYTIVDRGGVKVAIIGVTNPNAPIWDGEKVSAVNFEAVSSAVKRCIAEIGDKADVIMVSCHAGLTGEFDEEGGSDAASQILKDNPEVDVLMVGHYHVLVKEKDGNTLVGGTRNGARDVVRYDLTVDKDGNVTDGSVDVVDMVNYQPSNDLRNLPIVKEAHQKTIDFINGGNSSDGTTSGGVFGTATVNFQPKNEIDGIPEGKLQDTAVMDLINKVQLLNSGADVSAAALFKDTSDIEAGDINYGDIFNIYKFDNTLYRVQVTGAELKAYMEWSASCYNQWQEGDLSISFNPEKPGYLYDMFAGVDYEIDLSQPAGSRIKNVMFHGAPLKDDQTLTLAVNNYRYSSALKTYKLVSAKKEWESSNSIRDMLVAYIKEKGSISPEVDNNWKIVGVDLQNSNPDRAKLIELVNNGQLEAPYGESLNINKCANILAMYGNVIAGGKSATASCVKASDSTTYYRLRDIASALKGTTSKFNIEWNNGIVITTGAEYTADALTLANDGNYSMNPIEISVNGVKKKITVLSVGGSYYVSAEQLSTLLGITAKEVNGVITIA